MTKGDFDGLSQKLALENVTITKLERVETGSFVRPDGGVIDKVPVFTRATLEAKPGSGSYILAEVWMPDEWNGVFIGIGNSGLGTAISYGALAGAIRHGYAALHNDLGTSRGDTCGIGNQDVWKDYGWRATHLMTVAAKEVIQANYGKSQEYSYFMGGSSGGRQALCEAQRFPEDYDGIVAFKAVNNRVYVQTYRLWNQLHLTTPEKCLFTEEDAQILTACAVKFLGEDGDDFVSFPWKGTDTVEEFLAFVQKEHPSFTQEQIDALRAVYNGPVNPRTGERIYCGMPIGSEIYIGGVARKPEIRDYLFMWPFGEDYDYRSFDFDADLDRLSDALAEDFNHNIYDLTPFANRGGKLICYSGVSDPSVPYADAIDYYNHVVEACGGFEKTAEFFRFYLLPGMAHCGQGKGANDCWGDEKGASLIDAVRRWREEGIAPDTVAAMNTLGEQNVYVRAVPMYQADLKAGTDYPECSAERYRKW